MLLYMSLVTGDRRWRYIYLHASRTDCCMQIGDAGHGYHMHAEASSRWHHIACGA